MGWALIVIGLLVWLLLGFPLIGLILIVIGIALLFVPGTYGVRGGRRGREPRY